MHHLSLPSFGAARHDLQPLLLKVRFHPSYRFEIWVCHLSRKWNITLNLQNILRNSLCFINKKKIER